MRTNEDNPFVDVSRKHLSSVQRIPINAILGTFPLFTVLDDERQTTISHKAQEQFRHYPVRREGVSDDNAGQVSYLVGHRDGIEIGIEMHETFQNQKFEENKGKVVALAAVGVVATGATSGLLFHLRSGKMKKQLLAILDELSQQIEGGDHELIPALHLISTRILELPHRSLTYPFGWSGTDVQIIKTYLARLQRIDS